LQKEYIPYADSKLSKNQEWHRHVLAETMGW
jgi:hypothetical protein